MAKRTTASSAATPEAPAAEARKAVELWGLALRYASSAVAPAAKGAAHGVKERVAAMASSDHSVKDRLDPSKTEKGGKPGDAADALLGRMGKPGRLAAKTALGSRIVGRIAPSLNDDEVEPEAPTAESDADEPVEESEEGGVREDPPEAEASDEESEADASDDQPDEASEDERDRPQGQAKPVEPHPGAEPLHTDFEHAYSDEVENYEHQDAYAPTR